MTNVTINTNNFFQRVILMIRLTFSPCLHITYTLLCYLGLLGLFVMTHPGINYWVFDYKLLLVLLSIFLMLFFFRAVDEIKDYQYDRQFNPRRPLVTGQILHRDLYIIIGITMFFIIFINGFISWILLSLILFDMIYSLFLVWLEKKSSRVADSLFINLLVTYPVNIMLSLYLYLYFLLTYQTSPASRDIWILAAFSIVFLHFEMCRKTYWNKQISHRKGIKAYSQIIGSINSAGLAFLCGLLPLLIVFFLLRPWQRTGPALLSSWLLLILLVPLFLGQWSFFKIRHEQKYQKSKGIMMPYAMLFLLLFYALIIINAFVINKTIIRLF